MRIIAGSAGGIPITVPKTSLRPTTDRVREAVFSILGDVVEGASVLDLFAGSGAYGLESLSRGARRVVFVEADRTSTGVIRENLTRARLGEATVQACPVESWLRARARDGGAGERFDLIFADPPYAKQRGDIDWNARLLSDAALPALLAPGGWFVLESFARGDAVPAAETMWEVRDERRYGDARLTFMQLKPSVGHASGDHPAAV